MSAQERFQLAPAPADVSEDVPSHLVVTLSAAVRSITEEEKARWLAYLGKSTIYVVSYLYTVD